MGSRVSANQDSINAGSRVNQPSTAHIASGGRLSTALLNNQNARFAYDELVSECADFLSSPIINDTVTQFAENILTLIESPTTLDTVEVKRRIEQLLPLSHEYKHHRGVTISDEDCSRLCSLADRVINNAPYTNLNIVDENEDGEDGFVNNMRRGSAHNNKNDVQYIRQTLPNPNQKQQLPKDLPSFVESNSEVDGEAGIEYDMDVTPYDSEIDEPIRMV
jgi:hypothetical protein